MFNIHSQERQLIMRGSSRNKGISDIGIMAENIFLYEGTKDIGDIVIYWENNVLL